MMRNILIPWKSNGFIKIPGIKRFYILSQMPGSMENRYKTDPKNKPGVFWNEIRRQNVDGCWNKSGRIFRTKSGETGINRKRFVFDHFTKNVRIIVTDPDRYPNRFEITYKTES